VSWKTKLSKFLSFVLRHSPQKFGLRVDNFGFANLRDVFKVVKSRFPNIEFEEFKQYILKDFNSRFQLINGRIRARYGHSIKVRPLGEDKEIPDILFHGTSPEYLKSILKEGLKPQKRQFVHLSLTEQIAYKIGKRKSKNPVILKINASALKKDGFRMWREQDVILIERVPAQYIIEVVNYDTN